jgi:ABC-2 type transport system permease protein
VETDLSSGQVPEGSDLLLVLGPEDLDIKQQFAIDQFLMQGGTVLVAASSFHVDLGGGTITARPQPTGLEDWLEHQGLGLAPLLVLDLQNTPFPIPVQRNLGGFMVEEIQTLDYPYFPDVRPDGLAADSGITANLGQITMNWSSPIQVNPEGQEGRTLTRLIQSSERSWTSDSTNMQPDFDAHGPLGFSKGEDLDRKLLAVAVEGRFHSLFAGKPSPLLPEAKPDEKPGEAADPDSVEAEGEDETAGVDEATDQSADESKAPVISGVIESSPSSARLILIGSSAFATDTAISLANEATQTRYLKPIELIQNAVEWSLEDRGLLALRGRGQFSRLLEPVGREGRIFYEYLNYALALVGLVLLYWLARRARTRRARAQAQYLSSTEA